MELAMLKQRCKILNADDNTFNTILKLTVSPQEWLCYWSIRSQTQAVIFYITNLGADSSKMKYD